MSANVKANAALEIAWHAKAIGHCYLHGGTWKGTENEDESIAYLTAHPKKYAGIFSSEADARKHIGYAILAASLKTECDECAMNQHTILVEPQ